MMTNLIWRSTNLLAADFKESNPWSGTITLAIAVVLLAVSLSAAQEKKAEEGGPAQSQTVEKFNVPEFNEAASKHKQDLDDLRHVRGVRDALNKVASEDNLKQALGRYPRNTSLLFYSYEKDTLRIWLIDATGIRAYSRSHVSQNDLETKIGNLRSAIGVERLQSSRIPRLRGAEVIGADVASPNAHTIQADQALAELTALLLPDSIARGLDQVKHLIVVPVLDLGTVPYAILRPFGGDTYLIDKMSISIAPSLFDIDRRGQRLSMPSSESLIVGNPAFPSDPEWIFPDLPGAKEEANAVAGLIRAKPLIGEHATKEAILDKASRSELLYFATHGVADVENPLEKSFLVFSSGRWTAKEIQETRLRATLAVLSACQTGLGKAHNGGIIGLARAFQIAGVPYVVMSLWKVNDAATSQLMQSFMKHLRETVPSEALRQAMLDTRKERPNPSQWASFVIFGTLIED